MTLRRGVTVQGLVADKNGVPLTDGAVLLIDGRGTRTTKISRDGSYAFAAVAAGVYHLHVRRHLGTLGGPIRVRVEEAPIEQRQDLVAPR